MRSVVGVVGIMVMALPRIAMNPTNSQPITVALFWSPLQRWDGERTLPSLRFESPNAEGDGHRLALFLPSCPISSLKMPTEPPTLIRCERGKLCDF